MLYSNFTYIFRYRIIISCLCCTFFLRKYCLHLSSVSRKLCQLLTCIISITISYLAFHCSRFERTIYENVPVLKWITITLYNMWGESLISSISFSYVHKTINLHKQPESISKSNQKLQQLSVYICNIEVKLNQSVCCSSEFEYYFWKSESFNTLQFSDANTPATLTAWQSLFDFAFIINDVNQIYTRS